MPLTGISPGGTSPGAGISVPDTARLRQSHAAADFESLLIAQMLKSIRSEGSGWLGAGEDQASEAAFGIGEEELAKALATSGGFGLSKLIEAGLRAKEAHEQLPPASMPDTKQP